MLYKVSAMVGGYIIMNKDRQLLSLINAAQVLTSTLDLDKVLQQLIKETLNVIDGADAILLFVYDKRTGRLIAKNGVGVELAYLQEIKLHPGEGMTGKTFLSKKGQIFSHVKETERGMENIRGDNKSLFQKAVGALRYHPVSTICAPLLSKEECIGVLTIDSFSENVHFTNHHLLLLETFAAQASIAIENAKFFADTERSKKIHAELATASINQKGLEEITGTLTQLIKEEVCVYNEFFEIISSSSTQAEAMGTAKRNVIMTVYNDEVQNEGSLYCKEERIKLIPIKTDARIVIGILAIFNVERASLDTLDLLAIDLANNIFAREIIGQERLLSDYYKYEGYLLDQLLSQKLDSFSGPQKSIVGLSDNYRYICINIQIPNQLLEFEELNRKKQHFHRLLFREIKKLPYKVLVSEKNMEYDVLVMIHDRKTEEEITELFSLFFNGLKDKLVESISFDFHVGIGRLFLKIKEIQSSYREAKICSDYIKTNSKDLLVLSYKSLGIYRLFIKQEPEEIREYVKSTIGPLIDYDKTNGTDLLSTLAVYMENKQNMTLTAKQCFVHLNTIKYRLQNVKEILGIHLEGKEMFELQLAIYLFDYLKKGIGKH